MAEPTNYKTDVYEPQLIAGQEFEDFVQAELHKRHWIFHPYKSRKAQFSQGENAASLEIKYDKKSATTGNLYFEVYEKSSPAKPTYIPSGICRPSIFYGVGNHEEFRIFETIRLREYFVQLLDQKGKWTRCRPQGWLCKTPTSIGFVVPISTIHKLAVKAFYFVSPMLEAQDERARHDASVSAITQRDFNAPVEPAE